MKACTDIVKTNVGGFLGKGFFKNWQNSQENTCVAVSFLIKLQVSGLELYQKRDSNRERLFYRTLTSSCSLKEALKISC